MEKLKKMAPKSVRERLKPPLLSSATQTAFLAKMSHELRTPLNAIIGFSEMICNEKAGTINKEQREYLNDILASAKDLLQMINDVSSFAPYARKSAARKPKARPKTGKKRS